MIGPKHGFESVCLELIHGFDDGTISLGKTQLDGATDSRSQSDEPKESRQGEWRLSIDGTIKQITGETFKRVEAQLKLLEAEALEQQTKFEAAYYELKLANERAKAQFASIAASIEHVGTVQEMAQKFSQIIEQLRSIKQGVITIDAIEERDDEGNIVLRFHDKAK